MRKFKHKNIPLTVEKTVNNVYRGHKNMITIEGFLGLKELVKSKLNL